MMFNAARIYQDALYMQDGISSHLADRFPGQPEALASIIFAAMSLEAFMNETVFLAEKHIKHSDQPGWLTAFVDVINELEASKAPLQSKFLTAKYILSGASFDKGKNPYQAFHMLVRLRNEIVHQKAHDPIEWDNEGNLAVKRHNILESFRALDILGEYPDAKVKADLTVTNWVDDISTRAMARWACNAACGMVHAIAEAAPASPMREVIEITYCAVFKPLS